MNTPFYNIIIFIFSAVLLVSINLPKLAHTQIINKKSNGSSLSILQRKQVNEMIEKFLRENPRVILESVNNMREQQENEAKEQSLKNLGIYKELIFNDPASPTIGNPKGDVTIVEFLDYSCGYCKRVFKTLKQLIREDKNIYVIFKELPILSPQSELAARAALATWQQDKTKYIDIHGEFMTLKGRLSEKRILRIARNNGLDLAQLKKDMSSKILKKTIAENRRLAQKLNITGTPGFIIGNNIIPGAIELKTFRKIISDIRNKKVMN